MYSCNCFLFKGGVVIAFEVYLSSRKINSKNDSHYFKEISNFGHRENICYNQDCRMHDNCVSWTNHIFVCKHENKSVWMQGLLPNFLGVTNKFKNAGQRQRRKSKVQILKIWNSKFKRKPCANARFILGLL